MSMLDKALSRIDLLGIPIILNFSRSKKVKSSFGGSWTLAFFGFVIWALYNSGSELWQKEKPQVTEGLRFTPSLRPLELSSETVPIMVFIALNRLIPSEADFLTTGIYEEAVYMTYTQYLERLKNEYDAATYVQCNFTYLIHDTASSNGISGTWNELEPCTQAHFAGFDGIIDSDTEKLIDRSYCLPIKSYGLAYGFSISAECPYNSVIASNFADQNPTIELYYPKYGLSLQNYTHPTQPYLYNYRVQLGPYATGIAYSYWDMNYLDITTDKGWLTTSEKTDHYIQVAPRANSEIVSKLYGHLQRILIFKLSKEEILYTRTYTKLQNVLADVGGLAGSVLAVLLLFITPFARVKLSEAFVNEMFESRTEHEPKTPSEKQKSISPSKKSKKNLKRTNTANRSYLDRKSTVTINLQTLETEPLETTERNNKNPSKEIIPVKLESQNSGIPGDESPLMKTVKIFNPQSSPTKRIVIPQDSKKSFSFSFSDNVKKTVSAPPNIKKSFSEFDEIPTPAQSAAQTIGSHTFKSGFGHKNPFSGGDQNKNIGIEIHDLENQESNFEFTSSPIESPLKTEGDCDDEEQQMRKKSDIETQQDLGTNRNRNAKEVIEEDDESRKLRKDGVFGTLQLALPIKPKKILKPKVINITFLEYLKSFVYKSEPTRKKMKIIDRALNMLDSRLDVFNLLKKLRDVDKMKGLTLDKDQIYLFDRLPRPDIWDPSNHWYQEEYLSYYEILKGANELEELEVKAHIEESKRALENKSEKSEVDLKILGLI